MAILKHLDLLKDKFTIAPNELLQNETLSYEAKGLICELLSRPSDWIIRKKQLRRDGTGDHKLQRIINELTEAGYLYCMTTRSADGSKIAGRIWVASAYPAEESQFKKSQGSPSKMVRKDGKTPDDLSCRKPLHKKTLSKENLPPYKERLLQTKKLTKKEKNIQKYFNMFSMFSEEQSSSIPFQEKWYKFCVHREDKNNSLSTNAVELFVSKFKNSSPEEVIESINTSIESGWAGLFLPKFQKGGNGNGGNGNGKQPEPIKEAKMIIDAFDMESPNIKQLNTAVQETEA